jgi:hypothetical protein
MRMLISYLLVSFVLLGSPSFTFAMSDCDRVLRLIEGAKTPASLEEITGYHFGSKEDNGPSTT